MKNVTGRTALSQIRRWLTTTILILPVIIAIPGCGGCTVDPITQQEREEARKRREEQARREKPKPPFESFKTQVWPATRDESTRDPRVFVKPGHWMHATQRTRANNGPFNGVLVSRFVDRQSQKIDLPQSPHRVATSRPVSLPKEEWRELGTTVFVPLTIDRESKQVSLQAQLLASDNGREMTLPTSQPTESLKPHQYFAIVLSTVPERYGHLQKMPTFTPPYDKWDSAGLQVDYIVTTPKVDQRVPLPNHPLAWTSLAIIFWDDMDPTRLTTAQQESLIDWVNWGGQLVITSPRALALLRTSFLGPLLPAEEGAVGDMRQIKFDQINTHWSIQPKRVSEAQTHLFSAPADKPIQISELTLTPESSFVPNTADLVAERRVGRGRVALMAVSLDHRQFRVWQGYDNFVNGAVLRRPGREFSAGENRFPRVRWADYPMLVADARVTSSLRYFTRDASATDGAGNTSDPDDVAQFSAHNDATLAGDQWNFRSARSPYEGFSGSGESGVAGWSDFSPVANEARKSLQTAAGIAVPTGKFVASVLGIYLVFLVPINWLVFRIVGRVEWAWFAAPVISVLGAVGVIRSAHLDIGFVRSRTEISVVEMQPLSKRAHVSRFTALYTSLSTQYATNFADGTTVALPFSTNPDADRLRQQPKQEVVYRRDDATSLEGYSVLSNSTGMMRSESLRPIRGTCHLEGHDRANMLLTNDSEFDMQQVVVAARLEGRFWLALVGELKSGAQRPLTFVATNDSSQISPFLDNAEVTSRHPSEGEVGLRGLYQLGLSQASYHEGDCRLVGWSAQEVPGMSVSPRPNQETYRTFVLSHLRYGAWGPPQTDRNALADFDMELDDN